MRSPAAAALALMAALGVIVCGSHASSPRIDVIDLVRAFDEAEKRPPLPASEVGHYGRGGVWRAAILAPAPARLIWTLRLPARAALRAQLGVRPNGPGEATLDFRVGVSDDRIYEALAHTRVASAQDGWTPIVVDLSRYAGRKWSLFYRPDTHPWRLVLSVDAITSAGATAVWGEPVVSTDADAARTFAARQRP
jgi:hypothetical protein